MTKSIGDNYRIYSLILIIIVGIVINVKMWNFKMSKVSHLIMFLYANYNANFKAYGLIDVSIG